MIRKFIRGLCLLICAASAGCLIYLVGLEVQKEQSMAEMEEDLDRYRVIQIDREYDLENTENDVRFDWDGLLAESDAVVGWIQFEGDSVINYPIVQCDSNQYYLTHDWKGDKQFAGAIFLHKSNASNFTDFNSVIYGHRMKNRTMFGSFKYYSDQDYLDEHPYFSIYTPDGVQRRYEAFALVQTTDESMVYNPRFDSMEERMTWYSWIMDHAITSRDVSFDAFTTTATLGTCAASGYYNRIVLVGKLIGIELDSYPVVEVE